MRARPSRAALLLALLLPTALGLALLRSRAAQPGGKDLEVIQAGKTFETGRKWAIVVGVNQYLDPTVPKLTYSVADARLVARQLAEKCGYDAERILVLTDDQDKAHLRPLRTNLRKQVSAWLENAAPGDTVLVYFSGHGFLDKQGQAYLAPQDCDRQDLEGSGMQTNELKTMLEKCKATQKLLVLDCCHSGGKAVGNSAGTSGQEVAKEFASAKGLLTLASCKAEEESQEWQDKKQGLFTYFLAEGLAGAADADHNGIVDSDELYRYVYDRVRTVGQKDLGVKQTPVRVIGADVEGVFGLARAKGGGVTVAAPPREEGKVVTLELPNGVKMEFVRIPHGTFLMGSPKDEPDRSTDEEQHEVEITHDFYLGRYTVTQEQYAAVMGHNPSWFAPTGPPRAREKVQGLDTAHFPVERVSWDEAVRFCDRLTKWEQGSGRTFRLPTEAEWEYACRGGKTTPFYFGTACNATEANCNGNRPYGTATPGPHLTRTTVVGSYDQKAPHPWGLSDMHGNVFEWCQDWYGPYGDLGKQDPVRTNPFKGKEGRVVRGGGFGRPPAQCRSAYRARETPTDRFSGIGLRVCLQVD